MRRPRLHTAKTARRRTTLTLPADSLTQAERIARARKVNVSTVIAEGSEEVLRAYRKAFTDFSDEEMSVLDGILLEPDTRRR